MSGSTSNKIFTIPNLLTLIRLLCVPVFFVLLVFAHHNLAAFIFFAIAAVTDFFDGALARGLGQVSELGKQFDPLVDRILILAAVLGVLVVGRLPWWLFLILVARDASMLLVTVYMERRLGRHFSVVFIGKLATAVLMFSLCAMILDLMPWGLFGACLGAALSWCAGAYYIYRAVVLPPKQPARSSQRRATTAGASVQGPAELDQTTSLPAVRGARATSASGQAQAYRRPEGGRGYRSDPSAGMYSRRDLGRELEYELAGGRGGAIDARTAASSAQVYTARELPRSTARQVRAEADQTGRIRQVGSAQKRSTTSTSSSAPRRPRSADGARHHATPPRRSLFNPLHIAVATLIVVVLALGAFYVVNLVSNWGKIHQGVYVGTVDVGGLTTDQAAQLIDQVFQADAESKPVDLYQSDALREAGSTAGIDVLDDSVTDYKSSSVNTANTSWQLDADYLGVGVDGQALASQAAAFGHGGDFWLGTWRLAFGQQRVTPALTYDQTKLSLVDDVLTRSIGNWPVNWDLKYNSTQASYALKPGSDGHIVNMPLLQSSLDAAFLGADAQARRLTVPMMVQAPDVTQAIAQGCAATIQGLIAQPISLTYKAKQWSFSTKTLGNWLSIDPVQAADGSWSLKAEMSAATLKSNMKYMVGDSITVLKDPVDATFKVVGDTPYVVPARSGKGINYQELANQINAILYSPGGAGVGSGRSIALPLGTLAPDITTKEAEGMDIDERISTYTTTYNSTSERINNVHRGADLINGALVAPGGTFSFNKRTGECTAAKGFEAAPVIENGQDVDAIAGGLCQVATTLFNAVFESGLPVAERANHSLYIASYPTGRDAAVSYPQLDFKFTNDTDHYLLVQMSYTDTSLTCTLWGQDPGYQVTSQTGDWQTVSKFKTVKKKDPTLPVGTTEVKTAGQDARKITVRRIVKDKDGNVIRDTVFTSRYKAVNQVLLVGTKKG